MLPPSQLASFNDGSYNSDIENYAQEQKERFIHDDFVDACKSTEGLIPTKTGKT
jgi:hypothetical protein